MVVNSIMQGLQAKALVTHKGPASLPGRQKVHRQC
jgi:hypothetical protein